MKQEDIFREVGNAGLSGGFAIGRCLPRLKGNLNGFNIMSLKAIKSETSIKFINRIIEALDEKPLRNLESRDRQLEELLIEKTGNKRKFVLIINDAHLLTASIIHTLKKFHEIGSNKNFYPGIVFLGNVDKINTLVKKDKGVSRRSFLF